LTKRTVLNEADIARAITRISHEILESNQGDKNLVLLGIPSRGVELAKRISEVIQDHTGSQVQVGSIDVTMHRDDLANQPTRKPQSTVIPGNSIDGLVVVLVDDVLFSGRTVRAALDALGDFGRPKAVRLAVLIDRGHRELPIRADFVGKNLPTAQTERISVELQGFDGHEQVVIQQ
jgi:pyrimidine operon attenuation protein / uracil phosphoribosyltransferase